MPSTTRRTFLGTLAASAGASVAGCSSSCPDDDDPTPSAVFGPDDAGDGFDTVPGGSWPAPQFDAGNTGYAPSRRLPESPTAHWETTVSTPETDVNAVSSPTVANGTVYLATGDQVVALALRDGSVRWRSDSIGPVATGTATEDEDDIVPPVVAGGRVHLATENGLVALDADDGQTAWRYGPSTTAGVPTALDDGVVVPADDRVVRLSADGTEEWTAEVSAAAPAVADGTVVAVGDEETVALDAATGDRRWSASRTGETYPVATDGTVYLGSYGGLTALSLDGGEELWQVDRGGGRNFSAPVVTDDTIYVVERPGEAADATFAFDRSTDPPEPRWCSRTTEGAVAAAAGEHVFTLQPNDEGVGRAVELLTFTARFGEVTWGFSTGDRVLSPAVLNGGGVLATHRGTVVGFGGA
ncbi:Outer membrane protein assembly factor BamB, contains PQQ-like beta-propeller repeat [Haloplanus vescus]|uniref:Outer membrane protein assembly factor BamB, contains PQQ-like beta-propeller repeat n=1 Tax=Haloplanus vescus TaxID=555874 RepID=A0A1H3YE94_9EURY|nr:PQQ-binding-like beta-propeller repeat protein [Haloplanus vescus]SEA09895.1 Outer membrane protein assembly factor BamB, contains PQQ-like beta-propeller repeat [Haloplanus vescus]